MEMGSLFCDTAAALSEGSDKCTGRKYIGAFASNVMCSRGATLTGGGRHRIDGGLPRLFTTSKTAPTAASTTS